MQSSETGLQCRNREFFENFRPEQAFGETSGCEHPKFARDSNQLHHRPGTFLLFRKTGDLSAATGGPKSDIRLFFHTALTREAAPGIANDFNRLARRTRSSGLAR